MYRSFQFVVLPQLRIAQLLITVGQTEGIDKGVLVQFLVDVLEFIRCIEKTFR